MELKGRHAFVTGSAKRVGRAIAEGLIRRSGGGLKLSAHYHRSQKEMADLVDFGRKHGCEVHPVSADLADTDSLRVAAETAENAFGPVDVLVNSASDFYPTPALECAETQWDDLFDVNLKGQFFLTQALGHRMVARGGVVINLADVNGERAIRNYAPYCATKAGLIHLTRCLAKEWAPKVRVNAVSPGAVLLPENYTPEQTARAIAKCLLGRVGSPEDVAEGVLFLIANDYITGQVLNVDGGRSIR